MYRIVCGENTIFDPGYVNEYPVSEARLSERLNEGGALTFTLVQGHPQYNALKPMESYVTVTDEDELIFYGRVIECGLPSFSCQISYTCEGAISFLNDSEVPPNSSRNSTMTAEAFFRHCIAKHNEDINNDPRRTFTAGQVTAENRNKTDTFTLNSYTQTKNAIQNNLLNVYGGYLRIRVADGIRYIDWVEHYSDTVNPQRIVIGTNILERNFSRHWDEGIYTYLRPVGKNNLILDNPLIRVFSQEMVNKYGRIVKSVSFSDISTKPALQQKAEEYIANLQTELICEGDIELVDMQYIDGTSPKARLGDRYDNLEGLAGKELTVTEIERDLTVSYKARLSFGNDKKLSDNRSKALSQKSSRNRSSSGQNFKHIIEVGEQVTINADTLVQHGNTLNTHYELIQQTQNSYERIAADVETLSGDVQTIQGTGVIQNDELLSHFAGTMNIVRNPDGTVKGLQFVDGTMVCNTVNGHTVTVGSTIANHTVAIDGIDIQVQTIEGSALWTERDHITGVCGEYDVVIDDVTGTKTLVIKSGGGIKIKRNNTEFGLYDQGNLTGGIMVEKINDNSTVTKINGDKVNITATQLAQFGIVDPQTGTLTAGIVAGLINDQDPTQGTVTKIQGDRIIVGDIGTVSGDTVDDWMQNAYSGTGVFAKFLTVKRLTAQEITTLLANIADADIESVYAENIVAQQVSAEGTVSGNNFNVGSHLYYGQDDEFMILDATVSGNTLTIYKTDGTTINFSKATSLSSSWSGSTLTISASPQGNTHTVGIADSGVTSKDQNLFIDTGTTSINATNNKQLDVPVYVKTYVSGSPPTITERYSKTFTVNAASVYTNGWTAAYNKVSVPTSSNTGGSISVGVPPSTVDGTTATYTYAVSADNSYAYIKYGNTTVARASHSAYSNGWTAAYNKVSVPTSSNTGGSISVGVPPATVNGTTATYTYAVSADNSYAYIKYGNTTVARASHSAYSNGWTAAYNKVSVPTSSNTGGSISVGVPPSTVDGSMAVYTYALSVDSNYGYIKYGTTTVARVANAITIYPTSDQTLSAGGSVTVYARQNGTNIASITVSASGTSHSITITPDTVGKSSEPSGTELWSTTNFVLNRWYVMTVKCGTATKVYKIKVATSGKN